jgi:2'-5' RNA ligase
VSAGTQEQEFKPTGKTMLAIVPPSDICGFAEHYRRLYMPDTIHRIEPHITVTIPFVPFEELEEAAPRLQRVLASCPPRALAIRGFATFPEERVLYLYLSNPERVLSLYEAILAEFPDYPAFEGKHGDNIVPHMTVGTFSDPQELERIYLKLSAQRLFIGWDVEYLTVYYEGDDGRWHVWADLPLGVPLTPRND